MSTAGQAAARDSSADDLVVELEDYRIQIGRIKRRCEALVEGLGNKAFNWKPEERRWSICECLGHLNITAELYLPLIDRALAKSRSQGLLGDAPARRGLIGGWIVRFSEPPAKRRVKAPKVFLPKAEQPLDSVVPKFIELQDRLVERLRQANGLDLWRTKIRSPAIALLRLSLGETFALLTGHERRHLWQAEQVKGDPGFPTS